MLPAAGCTTANANPVATAASTALPPRRRISTPAFEASWCTLTTTACLAWTGRRPSAPAGITATAANIGCRIKYLRRTCMAARESSVNLDYQELAVILLGQDPAHRPAN